MSSEPKFTPGPWTVSEYTNYDGWSVFADVIGCVAERWPAYTMSEDQKTEAHANARLIAAAPELYLELKACIQNLTMAMLVMDAEARAVCMACIQAHKAVLAKAAATGNVKPSPVEQP